MSDNTDISNNIITHVNDNNTNLSNNEREEKFSKSFNMEQYLKNTEDKILKCEYRYEKYAVFLEFKNMINYFHKKGRISNETKCTFEEKIDEFYQKNVV